MSADIILTSGLTNSKLFRLLFKRIANALDQFDGMVLSPLLAPILTFFGPLFNVSRPFRSNFEPFPVSQAFVAHSLRYQHKRWAALESGTRPFHCPYFNPSCFFLAQLISADITGRLYLEVILSLFLKKVM